jgi:hypothetical protein
MPSPPQKNAENEVFLFKVKNTAHLNKFIGLGVYGGYKVK